jgi:hypothetical protein
MREWTTVKSSTTEAWPSGLALYQKALRLTRELEAVFRAPPRQQFDHMSLEDLRVMLRDVVRSGPNSGDQRFLAALANEVARREKPSQKGKRWTS